MSTRITLDALIALKPWSVHLAYPPRQKVSDQRAGDRLSIHRGRGVDFDEVRRYQPGDDIRAMDWRVTARTGHPHTKVFREERERPVYFLIDFQPTMFFGTQRVTKQVAAAEVAALYAWAARKQGDRVGGVIVDATQQSELPARGGDRAVLRLLHHLADEQWHFSTDHKTDHKTPSSLSSSTSESSALFLGALEHLWHRLRQGDALFVISDFYLLSPTIELRLQQLAQRADLSLIHVSDPLERASPPIGTYPALDRGVYKDWHVTSESHDPVAQLYHRRSEALQSLSRRVRARYLTCTTHLPLPDQRTLFRSPHRLGESSYG